MIFCVEDDENIRELVVYTLTGTGFEARGFADSESFFGALQSVHPDLVLLDIMLPGEDGLSILKRLRADARTKNIPVILLTARGSEFDKVTGLDLGADDYVVKPFGMMELVSRVRAVLRRAPRKEPDGDLESGAIRLSAGERTVFVGGRLAKLTPKEFDLLYALMRSPGRVLTRDGLLESVWGYEKDVETRTLDVHIRSLRLKLGECGDAVETMRGVGYRFNPDLARPA